MLPAGIALQNSTVALRRAVNALNSTWSRNGDCHSLLQRLYPMQRVRESAAGAVWHGTTEESNREPQHPAARLQHERPDAAPLQRVAALTGTTWH